MVKEIYIMSKYYYAVKEGKKIGVYSNWEECKAQVHGYPNAKYKKFATREEANSFIGGDMEKEYPVKNNFNKAEKDIKDLKENEVIAYVDGSFSLGKKMYSYGVVMLTLEKKYEFKGRDNRPELVEMRNVSGELGGAIFAMKKAVELGKDTLYLHYDYTGIEEWAIESWKANKKGTKEYRDFYKKISEHLKVHFIKVLAHSGVKYNEEADRLAKEAMKD